MICVDTNCVVAFLAGEDGSDVEFLDKLLQMKVVALPPVVVSELLSDPSMPLETELLIRSIPMAALQGGHWERAGKLRAKLAARGFRARLADTLIAQTCLDSGAPLLTRDKGFQWFSKVAGLKLL